MGLENTLDYLNAQECREISSHDAGMEKFDKLAHSAMTNKILSDIIYQVFLASTKEKYKCNIAISEEFNGLYENEEIFKQALKTAKNLSYKRFWGLDERLTTADRLV